MHEDHSSPARKPADRPFEEKTPILVRMAAEDLARIDSWISALGPPYISRPEAIRRMLRHTQTR